MTGTDGGRPLFQSERVAELLLDTLFSYRDQQKFQIHEFVIMPNHLHLLMTPGNGITIERALQYFKGGFSHRVKKELGIASEIWQRGYVDHRIRESSDYRQHREYIHGNPVRAHMVDAAEEYRYSSAHPGYVLADVPQGLKPRE